MIGNYSAGLFRKNGEVLPKRNDRAKADATKYYSSLGLSKETSKFLLEDAPKNMHFLTEEEADKYGIKVSIIPAPMVNEISFTMRGEWCEAPRGYELHLAYVDKKCDPMIKLEKDSITSNGEVCKFTKIQKLPWDQDYLVTSPCLKDTWEIELIDGILTTKPF
jgi:hypothetical protein